MLHNCCHGPVSSPAVRTLLALLVHGSWWFPIQGNSWYTSSSSYAGESANPSTSRLQSCSKSTRFEVVTNSGVVSACRPGETIVRLSKVFSATGWPGDPILGAIFALIAAYSVAPSTTWTGRWGLLSTSLIFTPMRYEWFFNYVPQFGLSKCINWGLSSPP